MKGINEQKKAELDTLAAQVLDAQHELDQCEATVAALTEKLNLLQNLLAEGESNTTQAQNNKTLIDAVVQSALDLQNNSSIAYKEIAAADSKTKDLAAAIKILMDKLIYSAEMINKLASIVTRKKALNPLISDELVSMINTAGSDANNAVALTLVALQSTFSATASNIMSEGALALENTQAITLYQMLTAKTEENKTA